MFKTKYTPIILCLVVSLLTITVLYTGSITGNHHKNGFFRKRRLLTLLPANTMLLDKENYYIAGLNDSNIYLANYTTSKRILIINKQTFLQQKIEISVPSGNDIAWQALQIIVQYPYAYLMDGYSSAIMRAEVNDFRFTLCKTPMVQFNSGIPLSSNSFILRRYSKQSQCSILTKSSTYYPEVLNVSNILTKQVDGLFATEGLLLYEPLTCSILYVYSFRNELLRLDTSLRLVQKIKTIDTISRAQVKPQYLERERMWTLAAPPLFVNNCASVTKDFIYVQSNLTADNEQTKQASASSVVDIYSLQEGRYLNSFYIPDIDNQKVTTFKIQNHTLIAISKRTLRVFNLQDYPSNLPRP